MSEPVTRQRPSVDLDEFERRMRQSNISDHDDDPLAELARMVAEQPDPYHDVFAHEAVAPAYQDQPYDDAAPRLAGSFAAIEAGLRGGISPHHDQNQSEQDRYDEGYGVDGTYRPGADESTYAYVPEPPAYAAHQPSRRPIYLMAATIAVGVLGVGAAFALKSHATSPSEIKTIMAASGPDKIQPPADAASDAGSQDSAKTGQAAPTKLVSNEEEPVDVAQTVKDNAAKDNAAKDGAGGQTTDASSVPVPPTPNQAAGDGVPVTAGSDFGLGMPPPKRVKVVSVRPDGTIVSGEASPAPAPAPEVHAQVPAEEATPAPAAPPPVVAKPSTPHTSPAPKSATRVVPRHATTATADAGDDAPAPPKPLHKTKPQKLAMAEPSDGAATDATPAPKTSTGGSFAVQLAAPDSESAAKSASSKLAKKFASVLDGYHLGFHKAESNGKSVYRVRVSSLSKDDAVSLCDKLKADGGTCFVARN